MLINVLIMVASLGPGGCRRPPCVTHGVCVWVGGGDAGSFEHRTHRKVQMHIILVCKREWRMLMKLCDRREKELI